MAANKFILNFTPTGMIPTREMTPHVPITPAEICEQVLEAAELGAGLIHLHAREPQTGSPTHSPELYGEIINRIRTHRPELILCVSTSGRNRADFAQRAACLDLEGLQKPDMASLTLSSLNFNKQASVNEPDVIKGLAQRMLAKGIKPELEAFDLGMINYARYLIRKDLLQPPYYFNLILGNIACAQADMLHLGLMVAELPSDSFWAVGGIGDFQLRMNLMGILNRGGARVGLEDNIWYDPERTRPATNTELVRRVVQTAGDLGFQPFSPTEIRRLLRL